MSKEVNKEKSNEEKSNEEKSNEEKSNEEKSNEEIKKDILKLILSTGELKTASDVSKMFSELQGQIYQDLWMLSLKLL